MKADAMKILTSIVRPGWCWLDSDSDLPCNLEKLFCKSGFNALKFSNPFRIAA